MEDGPPLPSLAIHLGRTKTTSGDQDNTVYLTDRPVEALYAWMAAIKIDKGSVLRGIGRWGTVSKRALDPQSVNAILKQRAEMAELDRGNSLRTVCGQDIWPRPPIVVSHSPKLAGIELIQ